MTLGLVFLMIFFSVVLVRSTDMVVIAVRRMGGNVKKKTFALSAVVLALGTSFPELSVGITSALEKAPSVSLGNVTGSNIANIALIGGLSTLIAGKIKVSSGYVKREVWVAMLVSCIPLIFLLDGVLSRIEGFILLAVYFLYAFSFFKSRYVQIGKEQKQKSFAHRFSRRFRYVAFKKGKEVKKLIAGIVLMLISADSIVRISIHLASLVRIPEFVIGLVIISVGTTLPELTFSVRSLKEHEPSMFLGNILGSTIANSTLILGIVAVIQPVILVAKTQYFIAIFSYIFIFLVFLYFIRTKHRLERWEGVVLLCLYLIFLGAEITGSFNL